MKHGDTPRVAAGIFKQKFKVKFESRNTKVIAWQHFFANDIVHENCSFC
jgi:hypothetical protein